LSGLGARQEALRREAAALEAMGDLEGAAQALERVLRHDPMHSSTLGSLAAARLRQGRAADAEPLLRRVLARRPADPAALSNLGVALRMLGRLDEAVAVLEGAVARPDAVVEGFDSLGAIRSLRGEADAAVAVLREAVRRFPRAAPTWANLGLALHRASTTVQGGASARLAEEGAAACRHAVEVDPSCASAWNNLGSIERDRGRAGGSVAAYRRAIAADPRAVEPRTNLAGVLRESGRATEAVAEAEQAATRAPHRMVLHSNHLYAMNFSDAVAEDRLFEAHAAFGRRFGTGEVFSEEDRRARLRELFRPGRPVRLGLVSADLRRHSVASFLEPLLEHLDRGALEVTCYADVPHPDEVTRRLRSLVPSWREIHARPDDEVLAMIRADSIEILVDLAGHTAGNRLGVFARRAAPVQVSYLGYPNTTGLPQVDFRLVDDRTDPPGSERLAVETLLRVPGGFLCFRPDPDRPARSSRDPRRPITFGSFNSAAKITPTTIDLWASVLRRVPGSRLLLKARGLEDPFVADPLRAAFAAREVDPARLELRDRVPDPRGHLAAYSEVDVALDTFPYHGTTTTCEALSMGVPVVSRAGGAHRSRVGSSILRSVEHVALTCRTDDGFADRAASLAANGVPDPGGLPPNRSPRAFAEELVQVLRRAAIDPPEQTKAD